LTGLSTLSLQFAKVSDACLANLTGLGHLKKLHLQESCVTDEGLDELAKLKQLQLLTLTRTEVTNAGAARLKRAMPNCHVYDRDGFEVLDTGNR
jgi:hypothetical protein